jgi:hypothetical protein
VAHVPKSGFEMITGLNKSFEMVIRRNAFSNTVMGSCIVKDKSYVMTDTFQKNAMIIFLTSKDADLCASKTKEKTIQLHGLRIVEEKKNCLIATIEAW